MEKYARLIVKEGFWGKPVRDDLIAKTLILHNVDLKRTQMDVGFFNNTYTFVVCGEMSNIIKAWNELRATRELNVRLEEV